MLGDQRKQKENLKSLNISGNSLHQNVSTQNKPLHQTVPNQNKRQHQMVSTRNKHQHQHTFWCLGLFLVDTFWCIGLFRVDTIWSCGLFWVDAFWCRLLQEISRKISFQDENEIFQNFIYDSCGLLPSPFHTLKVFPRL
jgi:hypothetical protein